MRWSYGVTTCLARVGNGLLARTLASLARAGFDRPRVFADGVADGEKLSALLKLEVTARFPNIRTHGNWVLSLYELYIRTPDAERYALFQDDFTACVNLRAYLERAPWREKTYQNLYTFPENQKLCPKDSSGAEVEGFYPSNQLGKGAVALVFDRPGVLSLLTSAHMVDRPQSPTRGWRSVDGGIVDSLRKVGYTELVHHPSLVQHVGLESSMGNRRFPQSDSYRGEDYDATQIGRPSEYLAEGGWQKEWDDLHTAMAADEARLREARDPDKRRALKGHLRDYRRRIEEHGRLRPPAAP